MNSVFTVKNGTSETYEVKGYGQEATNSILNQFKGKNVKIIFNGFLDRDRKFIPVIFK